PSPVHSLATVRLWVGFILLPLASACAMAEPINLARADGAAPRIDSETPRVSSTLAARTAPPDPSPAPPTEAAFMTEGSARVVGYDAFGPEGPLAFRTTFTPRPGSDFARPAADTVWVGRREAFGPAGRRDVETTS